MNNFQEDLIGFINRIKDCNKCAFLHHDKKINVTISNINHHSPPILIVGEAPGKTEYDRGCIFCGKSGQFLREALRKTGADNLILINTVKCRPPENRTPTDEEINNCLPFLEEQIRIIEKHYQGIHKIACGRIAEKALQSLGISHSFIYHPSYALRNGWSIDKYVESIKPALIREEASIAVSKPLPLLHVHSDYSVADGIITVQGLCQFCKEKKIPVCLTDDGTMAGLYELELMCLKEGLDYIPGYEAYIETLPNEIGFDRPEFIDDSEPINGHLLILVSSEEGFKNLLLLHNTGASDKNQKRVVIHLNNLLNNCKGLVISTACIGGIVAGIYQRYGEKMAIEAIKIMDSKIRASGGEFYLEIMPHNILKTEFRLSQAEYNKFLERVHRTLGIKMIVTTDAHYSNANDKDLKIFASASAYNNTFLLSKADYFPGNTYHLEIQEEDIRKTLIMHGLSEETINEAIKTTKELGYRLAAAKRGYRIFQNQKEDDNQEEFDRIISERWQKFKTKLSNDEIPVYEERLQREIKLIKSKNYCNYFVRLHTIMEAFRNAGIKTGISRGSGGGSLVAFLMKITFLDPIKHGLLFERFLNEAREDPPDIDIDVQMSRRDEAIRILQKLFGAENVAQISTYITFQEKGLKRDLTKAAKYGCTLPSDSATRLYGIKKFKGVHASGLVIMDNIQRVFPLSPATTSDLLCIELDLDLLTALNVVKYDFLGLTGLDIIYRIPGAEKALVEAGILTEEGEYRADIDPELQKRIIDHINQYPLDIFQVGTESCIPLLHAIRPANFQELTHLVSLNRPGPRDSGMVDQYIANAGKGMEGILSETRGCCIFQEQLILILKETFDLTLTEAEELRRIISKKKADKLAEWEKRLNINKDGQKKAVWEQAIAWADYGFNKSHATGYAALSMISGYLKMEFPEHFYATALNYETDEIMRRKLMKEAREYGITFIKPQLDVIFNQTHGLGRFCANEDPETLELKNALLEGSGGESAVVYLNHFGLAVMLGLNTIMGIKSSQAEKIITRLKNSQKLTPTQISILKKAGFYGGNEAWTMDDGDISKIEALSPYYHGLADGRDDEGILRFDTLHLFSHNGIVYCEDNGDVYPCICIPAELINDKQRRLVGRFYRYKDYVITREILQKAVDHEVLYKTQPMISAKNNIYQRLLIKHGNRVKEVVMMKQQKGFGLIKPGENLRTYGLTIEGDFVREVDHEPVY